MFVCRIFSTTKKWGAKNHFTILSLNKIVFLIISWRKTFLTDRGEKHNLWCVCIFNQINENCFDMYSFKLEFFFNLDLYFILKVPREQSSNYSYQKWFFRESKPNNL